MVASKRLSVTLNPSWPQYFSLFSIVAAVFLGLSRIILFDQEDPLRCRALLSQGRWLDYNFANWQPDGCMAFSYRPSDVTTCLSSTQVVFIGDSVTRKLFFQFAHLVDPSLSQEPPDDDSKHNNHTLQSKNKISLKFLWDPFLNSSYAQFVHSSGNDRVISSADRPSLLVVGTGLWYLRYSDGSGGLPAWESRIESVLETIKLANPKLADEIVFLPIEEPITSKLSPERASTIHPSVVEAMNSDLYHRIYQSTDDSAGFLFHSRPLPLVSVPLVFNQMLDSTQTDDGLHFSNAIVRAQANLLLNLRCNDRLSKHFPMDKTCCSSYPTPSTINMFLVAVLVLWGPILWLRSWLQGQNTLITWVKDEHQPSLIISGAIALVYVADRTGFWLKEQKEFNPWTFSFFSLICLVAGLSTVKKGDKDTGFLNREQTDEWKGWMQVAILLYHYTGASKISGIYNPIRVMVAAYLFMTGYGHTVFYVKKADFGFLRVAQVMIRLNLLTVILAYAMNTDYLFYYFAPLVSMWYLVIYVTMFVGARYNDRTPFLICKILASMTVVTWFMNEPWLLENLFQLLEQTCGIRWSAKEWSFRVNLDLWIVYFGMFTALISTNIRERGLTDHALWPICVKTSVGVAAFTMLWFLGFEVLQPSKFTYNDWHPYISFLPVIAFSVLRNANQTLRSTSSYLFAFIGRCSLETFIIQYHLWLAADTKGLLIVIPWTRWRSLNLVITTPIFIYVSHQVSQATAVITAWICGSAKGGGSTLPTHTNISRTVIEGEARSNRAAAGTQAQDREESIPLTLQDGRKVVDDGSGGGGLPREPDTPIRPHRWVDRLAEGSQTSPLAMGRVRWRPGVMGRVVIGLCCMWAVNMMWPS